MRGRANLRVRRPMNVHPTAVVSKKAEIASDVSIGPCAVIGDGVSIGKGTTVGAHAVIEGKTQVGEFNKISPGVVLGLEPQILDFEGADSGLEIGSYNIIREYVTIHRGGKDGSSTVMGSHNYIMAYVHVAHDSRLGNHITIANATAISGHMVVEDHAFISGFIAAHQFVRIGCYSMVGGMSRVPFDIPPYSLCNGVPAALSGVNIVGLKRANFSEARIRSIKSAFRSLFFSKKSFEDAMKSLAPLEEESCEVKHLAQFIRESQRGITFRN